MAYQHGGDIYTSPARYDFSVNSNPYGTPGRVRDAAVKAMENVDRYPDPYCRRLTKALSEKLGVRPAQITVGNGAAELIFTAVLALSEQVRKMYGRPLRALLPVPSFYEYEHALTAVGAEITYSKKKVEDGFALTEDFLSCMDSFLRNEGDVLILCSPDNPGGQTIRGDILRYALKKFGRHRTSLIIDESFYEFSCDSEKDSVLPYLSDHPRVTLIRSFTKMYGICGLRLGYAVSGDPEFSGLMREYTQPWNVSIPAQEAGIAALKETEWAKKTRTLIRRERERLRMALASLGFQVFPSEANFLLFRDSRESAAFSKEDDLCLRLLARGILIRDCSNYRGLGPGFYRVAVRSPEENQILIQTLTEVI